MSYMNRAGNISNRYQTPAKRVLCVCSAGLLRSPTAANVLHQEFGYNTRAVGCDKEFALLSLDEILIMWADEIVCMERGHEFIVKTYIPKHLSDKPGGPKIITLNIPDIYSWNDPELRKLILKAYKEKAK